MSMNCIERKTFAQKNKTWQQLKNARKQSFLVKDNILVGSKDEIPLYLFGFLY